MILVADLRPVVDEWLAKFVTAEEGYQQLAASSGIQADSWRKRLSDTVSINRRGTWRGWWSLEEIDEESADELLTAMGFTDALADLTGAPRPGVRCHDCDREITPETGYRPLDLWRRVPDAPSGRSARAGGRRKLRYDLCRRCAGEALRLRAAKNGNVSVNGKRRYIRSSERLAPRMPGRPGLLNDAELRQLHIVYLRTGRSISDLARGLKESRPVGTYGGFSTAILYGWRRLGLPVRPRSEQLRLSHHLRGRIPREPVRCPATTRKGSRCALYVKDGLDYCVSHQHLAQVAA